VGRFAGQYGKSGSSVVERRRGGGGFADLHRAEYWKLDFVEVQDHTLELKNEYHRLCDGIA
jgi:3-deoxy-D-arabino-heptulosonate 7-phosphate (DAHP) synthase class II